MKRRTLLIASAAAAAGGASPAFGQAASGFGAPVIELYVPAAILTLEQKSALIKGFTEIVERAMRMPADPARHLFMTIVETAEGGFGVDGKVFTPRK
jgi:hypothetical protein